MRFSNKVVLLISKTLLFIAVRIQKFYSNAFVANLERRLHLGVLYRTDRLAWIAEHVKLKGVTYGDNCRFYTREFSSEPYLVEIGDNVCVASGTQFITHDGGAWLFYDLQDHAKDMNIFSGIKVGNNCFIGINCIILPGAVIGDNCVVGAGSVVRGVVPANSVVMGNPAKVVMKTTLYEKMLKGSRNLIRVDMYNMSNKDKKNELVKKHFKNSCS